MHSRSLPVSVPWHRGVRALSVVALMCGAPSLASAQDSTAVQGSVMVGTRVRLWQRVADALTVPVVGRVTRVTADTVGVLADGLATPVALPRPVIARVDISAGRHAGSATASAIRGAIIGALGGAVLGTIAGNLAKRNAAKFAIAGFGMGGGVGAGIGAATPGEAWRGGVLPATPTP